MHKMYTFRKLRYWRDVYCYQEFLIKKVKRGRDDLLCSDNSKVDFTAVVWHKGLPTPT